MNNKLVSCILPTYNRPHYLLRAIFIFSKQNYLNKELIIIDDSIESKRLKKVPILPNVTYIQLNSKKTIGYKRNLAVKHANGDIFMFWDDDDMYSRNRITKQVAPILKLQADLTVFQNIIYHDSDTNDFYKTTDSVHNNMWYLGYACGTIASKKQLWHKIKFKNTNISEDKYYIQGVLKNGAKVKALLNNYDYIYTRHKSNSYKMPLFKKIIIQPNKIPKFFRTKKMIVDLY